MLVEERYGGEGAGDQVAERLAAGPGEGQQLGEVGLDVRVDQCGLLGVPEALRPSP